MIGSVYAIALLCGVASGNPPQYAHCWHFGVPVEVRLAQRQSDDLCQLSVPEGPAREITGLAKGFAPCDMLDQPAGPHD